MIIKTMLKVRFRVMGLRAKLVDSFKNGTKWHGTFRLEFKSYPC